MVGSRGVAAHWLGAGQCCPPCRVAAPSPTGSTRRLGAGSRFRAFSGESAYTAPTGVNEPGGSHSAGYIPWAQIASSPALPLTGEKLPLFSYGEMTVDE